MKDLIEESKSLCNSASKQTFAINLESNIEQFRIESSAKSKQYVASVIIDNIKLLNNECPAKPSKKKI